MKKIFTSIFSLLILGFGSYAQETLRPCSTTEHEQEMLQRMSPAERDAYYASRNSLEQFTADYIRTHAPQKGERGVNYVIPIVFHIIHTGGPENISNEQVYSAVDILNEDYQKLNSDAANVVTDFLGLVADVGIEFRLAQKDPNGNCTSGITRTFSNTTNTGAGGGFNNAQMAAVKQAQGNWPGDEYLNVFVVNNADGAAGYTMTPSTWVGGAMENGIIILHNYVGKIGTSNYALGRALTHEVGHWLNLSHTWGSSNNPGISSNCNGDDGVADTPNTIGWTSCNLSGNSCSSLDNVENFMEYSYCSKMFTEGQKSRMIAALNSSVGGRNNVWSASNLTNTGVDVGPLLCQAEFEANRYVICAGDAVEFTDMSYNGITGWNWTFNGGTPSNSTSQNPTVTYNTPGTYSVTLDVDQGGSPVSTTKTNYITVIPSNGLPNPYSEGFESMSNIASSGEWFLYNPDGLNAWEVTSSAAYTGSKSVKLNNLSNVEGQVDELMSTTIDLSGATSVILSFKYAFAQTNTNDADALKVYVSKNCGQNWSMRKNLSGTTLATTGTQTSSFTPTTTSQWAQVDITNISPTYLVDNFRFKFEMTNGGGNNIYIDDINLSVVTGVDELTRSYNLSVYPNPVEDVATIAFELTDSKKVELDIYDVVGRKVIGLANSNLPAGEQKFTFNKEDLSSGIYMVRLKVGNSIVTRKVVINK